MEPIQPVLSALAALQGPSGAAAAPSTGGADFMKALGEALNKTDAAQTHAENVAKAYQMGEAGVSLESSMIAMQEANISLQFAVQVRNKVVSAYHDIMNMPV